MGRPDWIICVQKGTSMVAECGLKNFDFKFASFDNAFVVMHEKSRLILCPDCYKVWVDREIEENPEEEEDL